MTAETLQELINKVQDASREFGLEISIKKSDDSNRQKRKDQHNMRRTNTQTGGILSVSRLNDNRKQRLQYRNKNKTRHGPQSLSQL